MPSLRSRRPPAPVPTGSGTVMVIDDSPTIRKILGLTLERAGYTVLAEPDGEAALERLQQVVPNLILLDISMPKFDGYEVCKRIKLDPRTAGVPVIMLSGKGAFFDKVKGHMAGATEYLTKPFETPAVLAIVTSHASPERGASWLKATGRSHAPKPAAGHVARMLDSDPASPARVRFRRDVFQRRRAGPRRRRTGERRRSGV